MVARESGVTHGLPRGRDFVAIGLLALVAPACAHDAALPSFQSGQDGSVEKPSDAGESSDAGPNNSTEDASPLPGARSSTRLTSLVDYRLWRMLSEADDPYADRPEDVVCPSQFAFSEILSGEPAFSVDTGNCNYITARQKTIRNVDVGDTLVVRIWHFALTSDLDSATAHVSVRLGDQDLLDTAVPIPAEGGLLRIEQVTHRPIPAGTDAYFHLHNHGSNEWSIVEFSAGRAE